jgi:hypothetical protein
MKILFAFGIIDVNIFFYIIGKILKSLMIIAETRDTEPAVLFSPSISKDVVLMYPVFMSSIIPVYHGACY